MLTGELRPQRRQQRVGHDANALVELRGLGHPAGDVTGLGLWSPDALGKYQGRAAAIVQAFFPGEEGGGALAGVLSGRVNPWGKLPVEVPRHAGGQPHTYLAPPLGQDTSLGGTTHGVSNLDPTAAFSFGHGLSYTSFGYT
jgi:Glycosyl hydrolase family 3 C-terminal domain